METFPRYWLFVRSPVNSPHKGQWHGALMFSLICVWLNGWVNNREAGDLRRCRAHYDVTVMQSMCTWSRSERLCHLGKSKQCRLDASNGLNHGVLSVNCAKSSCLKDWRQHKTLTPWSFDEWICQWTGTSLIKVMDCRMFGAKPFLNQCCRIVTYIRSKFHRNFNLHTHILIQRETSSTK